MGNLLDLWLFGGRLATAQVHVSVRIGKGRKILRLYYPYIDLFRVHCNCYVLLFKVARLDFLGGIPPKFEH